MELNSFLVLFPFSSDDPPQIFTIFCKFRSISCTFPSRSWQIDIHDLFNPSGRGDITTTRSDKNTTSSILCVTKIMVFFVFSHICRSCSFKLSLVNASNAPKARPSIKSGASWESALTIETLCLMPRTTLWGELS